VVPSFERAFSFADLVALSVAFTLKTRGVSEKDLRLGILKLREMTGSAHPLTSKDIVESIATSGSCFLLYQDGNWYDVGKGKQGTFTDVVSIWLKHLAWDEVGNVAQWHPAPLVLIDPGIQAGAPCVEGTRVPTSVIFELVEGEAIDEIAEDLDLSIDQVESAISFETALSSGKGLLAA
jgi:uncharacterized protein (DUF433 family)